LDFTPEPLANLVRTAANPELPPPGRNPDRDNQRVAIPEINQVIGRRYEIISLLN